MKAIILAAGYATRLYPLTLNQPKPLLEIGGKSMMDHIINKISEIKSIDLIFVVTNNKFASNFESWSKKNKASSKINIINDKTNNEAERLGALGDINYVIEKAQIDDDLLIFGGDNLFEDSLAPMYHYFLENQVSVVGFKDVNDLELAKKMGVGTLDKSNKIIEFVEKPQNPKSTLVSTLVYFLRKEDIKLIKECILSKSNSGEVKAGDLMSYMITKTTVHGFVLHKKWFDIGSLEQLKEADAYWSKK